jgi:hypothetical protein
MATTYQEHAERRGPRTQDNKIFFFPNWIPPTIQKIPAYSRELKFARITFTLVCLYLHGNFIVWRQEIKKPRAGIQWKLNSKTEHAWNQIKLKFKKKRLGESNITKCGVCLTPRKGTKKFVRFIKQRYRNALFQNEVYLWQFYITCTC